MSIPGNHEAGAIKEDRGPVIAIGGAEDKVRDLAVLNRIVALLGGRGSCLAVISTASRLADTGQIYVDVFRKLGVEGVESLPIKCRRDTQSPEVLDVLERADGVFFTGGNQVRLSSIIGGTPVARTIRRRNAQGMMVAGTSAGAAILSEHMIAYGREGATPRPGMVAVVPGLGLVNSVIIDQHFRQRDRLGRLLTALAYNPFAIGLGLDEDTAVVIDAQRMVEVVGTNAVTIVDASAVSHNDMGDVREGEAISLFDLRLHIVVSGGRFDLSTRRVKAGDRGDERQASERRAYADMDVDGIPSLDEPTPHPERQR